MKSIIELTEGEARNFLIKQESYVNFDLPLYFSFQELLLKLDKELSGKLLSDLRESSPRNYDDINYQLLNNKDGKYAWRPYQLIHPSIYISLVHTVTDQINWKIIQERFDYFQLNKRIECHSLPMIPDEREKTAKESQIFNWWQNIEQRSISLALDYRYVLKTDITDCYGSLYTHSIAWALHTKEVAKKRENRTNKSLVGVSIDSHLQDMSYGQTNGIPQGSILMDFIAEIVLGYVDSLLTDQLSDLKIEDYHILRYRDDYRIFTNNPFEAEQITKALSEILSDMGFKLNASKTESSDNIIKNSLKPDKRYWISNKRITENKQKWLIQLYLLSEKFPNSGTLDTQMRKFLTNLKESKREDPNIESLVSLVTEIAVRNPRVCPSAVAILSLFIKQVKEYTEKKMLLRRIRNKFQQIPNSSYLKVWLQRLYLKIDESIEYEELLCQKVLDDQISIWNSEWLNDNLKNIINKTPIIKRDKLEKLKEVVTKREIKKIVSVREYEYQV